MKFKFEEFIMEWFNYIVLLLVLIMLIIFTSSCQKEEPCYDYDVCRNIQHERLMILDAGYEPGVDYSMSFISRNADMLSNCKCYPQLWNDTITADEFIIIY
jgi:hypothetical protein